MMRLPLMTWQVVPGRRLPALADGAVPGADDVEPREGRLHRQHAAARRQHDLRRVSGRW